MQGGGGTLHMFANISIIQDKKGTTYITELRYIHFGRFETILASFLFKLSDLYSFKSSFFNIEKPKLYFPTTRDP